MTRRIEKSLCGPRLSFVLVLAGISTLSNAEPQRGAKINEPTAGLSVPLWTPGASSQTTHPKLHFENVPLMMEGGTIQLSGANISIDPLDWRAVAIATNSGGEGCTLTLIGPAVVLLAAHCVDNGVQPGATSQGTALAAEVDFGNGPSQMKCVLAPAYLQYDMNPAGAPRSSADYALCDIGTVTGIDAEVIATAPPIAVNAPVTLMGYGCTELGLSDDGYYTFVPADNTLRLGSSMVRATAVSIYAGVAGTYFTTLSASPKQPNICYGDSGGPAMIDLPPAKDGKPRRRVVAVNSGLGATEAATPAQPAFYSYLSPLAAPEFIQFMTDWTAQKGVPIAERKDRRICGYDLKPGSPLCRS